MYAKWGHRALTCLCFILVDKNGRMESREGSACYGYWWLQGSPPSLQLAKAMDNLSRLVHPYSIALRCPLLYSLWMFLVFTINMYNLSISVCPSFIPFYLVVIVIYKIMSALNFQKVARSEKLRTKVFIIVQGSASHQFVGALMVK